jgi:hypothetical protein
LINNAGIIKWVGAEQTNDFAEAMAVHFGRRSTMRAVIPG